MSTITEVAPDVYRISTYVPEANLQFNQFVVKDDEPLLGGSMDCSEPTDRPIQLTLNFVS